MCLCGRIVKNQNMQESISIAQKNLYNDKKDTSNGLWSPTILKKIIG